MPNKATDWPGSTVSSFIYIDAAVSKQLTLGSELPM